MSRRAYGRLLGLLCVLVLVIALALRISFFVYALYGMIGLLVTSHLIGRHALRGLRHVRHCGVDHAELGQTVSVALEIVNDKPLPVLWLLAEETLPERLPAQGETGIATLLGPQQRMSLHYVLDCRYRGYHQIGPVVLESGDLFGLVRRFQTGDSAHFITVYPRVVPIGEYQISARRPIGEVKIRQPLFEDPTRVAGVRDYRTGDPLNRIHWKATARTGRLHSKIYEHTTMIGANIVLDFHRASWDPDRPFDDSELAVTAAASIAAFVLEQKQQVGFVTNGGDAAERAKREFGQEAQSRQEAQTLAREREEADRLRPFQVPMAKGEGQYLQLMEALARVEMRDALTCPELIASQYEGWPRDETVVVIVPEIRPALAQQLARLRASGFVVTVIVVRNPDSFHAMRPRLDAEGIQVLHLAREADLNVLAYVPV